MLLSGKARIPRMAKSMNQMHKLMISPAGNGGKVNPRSDRSGQQAGDGCRENLGCSSPAGTSLLQTGWAVETTAGGQTQARDCPSSGTWQLAQRVCSHGPHGGPWGAAISRVLTSCVTVFSMLVLKTGIQIPSNPHCKPQMSNT